MRASQIPNALAAASSADAESALAAEMQELAHSPGEKLVEIWRGNDPELSARALGAMIELEESSVVPLLRSADQLPPEARVQALRVSVESELTLRRRVLKELEAMLDDRRPLPSRPQGAPTERAAPSLRVCDEAFLLIRQLVHFGEEELDSIADGDAFLELPDALRDETIAEARRTRTWNRLKIDEVDF